MWLEDTSEAVRKEAKELGCFRSQRFAVSMAFNFHSGLSWPRMDSFGLPNECPQPQRKVVRIMTAALNSPSGTEGAVLRE